MEEEKKNSNNKENYKSSKVFDLYPAAGGSIDWFYYTSSHSNDFYSFAVELSPQSNSKNGFILHTESILKVCESMILVLIEFLEELIKIHNL